MPITKVIYLSLLIICSCKVGKNAHKEPSPIVRNAQNIDTNRKVVANPMPYKEVITDKASTEKGLFTIHTVDNHYYFEIPDSIFGKEILIVNRISRAAAEVRSSHYTGGMFGYAGDEIGKNVIQFSKGPNNRVFIKQMTYGERSIDSSKNGLYQALLNSSEQAIIAAFDIKAISPDKKSSVIEVTELFNADNNLFSFSSQMRSVLNIGAFQSDKSYIQYVHSYPLNIELSFVKTFLRTLGQGVYATFQLNSSLILLPRDRMPVRYWDERVGYFQDVHYDYDADPQGVVNNAYIVRWRLEPKDKEKYKKGELVEPKKPIIFYIDPATPKKWVPYLIQGVNDWQQAFEKAGFKNAIYARDAPSRDEDSTWTLEDARYSAIVYKPSVVENAFGPNIHDPRTGEILESHVSWYHSVMQLLHDWYFVQAAAVDPKARKMIFDDSLMGQLIRFVSSHEIGHALGLTHNFLASSTVPVDSLRNKKWVEANGICPSIMDYARFNYVAQPEDSISENGLLPRIGSYDKWAIEWGYRLFPDIKTQEDEKSLLNKWIRLELSKNSNLKYITEGANSDPRNQAEDLSDNVLIANEYGIKNLKRIVQNLKEWTYEPGKNYEGLDHMYNEIYGQYKVYIFHATKYIGGVLYNPIVRDDTGIVWKFWDREKQKAAIDFLQHQLFDTPKWLSNEGFYGVRGGAGPYEILLLQQDVLKRIFSQEVFYNLIRFESNQSDKAYTVRELLNDLKHGIWREITIKSDIDLYRRNLQKAYVEQLLELLKDDKNELQYYRTDVSDVLSIVKNHLNELKNEIAKVLPEYKDKRSKEHLNDLYNRLENAFVKCQLNAKE